MTGIRHSIRQECAEYIRKYFNPASDDPSEFWGRVVHDVLGGPVCEGEAIGRVSVEQFSERQYNRLLNAGQEIYLLAEAWRKKYPEAPEPRSDGWAAMLALTETVGVPARLPRASPEQDAQDPLRVTYLAVVTWLINVEDGLAARTSRVARGMKGTVPES